MKLIIKKPTDAIVMSGVQVLLYGSPGVRKSSFSFTAPNPILFDFDNGMRRVDAKYRGQYLSFDQINTWEKLVEIRPEDLKEFDTIIFDPIGKLMSICTAFVAAQNVKNRMSSGVLTQTGWGTLGMTMRNWLAPFKASGKNIVSISHDKEEKDGDNLIKRPDIAGQLRGQIMSDADFIGYMMVSGGQNMVCFSPSDNWYGKNSCGLPAQIPIASTSLAQIFEQYTTTVNAQSEEYQSYRDQLTEWMDRLYAIENEDDLNYFIESCSEMKASDMWLMDAGTLIAVASNEKAMGMGLVWNKSIRKYEVQTISKPS